MTTTREIAGHSLTLIKGRRYLAQRPITGRGVQLHAVSITDQVTGYVVAGIPDLPYDQANDLLAAFNNGKASWEGRIWH